MKVTSWNVNSVRQRLPNLLDFLAREAPDFVCLQELKCTEDAFPFLELQAAGYEALVAGQKSYNGVAILGRKPMVETMRSAPDEQARLIEVEADGVHIINIYAPNGNPVASDKFTYKLEWLGRLQARAKALLEAETPFLICGDFNIIPENTDAFDIARWRGDALFMPEARAAYRRLLNMGLYDALRMFFPHEALYTFWDYQAGAWARNDGIRIDHFLLSPQVADNCKGCTVHKAERGLDNPSDHVPISVSIQEK